MNDDTQDGNELMLTGQRCCLCGRPLLPRASEPTLCDSCTEIVEGRDVEPTIN